MEALFVSGDIGNAKENNTSQYRIHGPAKYLIAAGHNIVFGNMPGSAVQYNGLSGTIETNQLDWSLVRDTVLFERNISPERVELLRLNGAKRIIVTFDDNYGLLPPYMASYDFWQRNYKPFLKALGMVDLVIVPSMRLLSYFETYCRKIKYIPNYLDPERWPTPKIEREKIIGWGGSMGHIESWRNNNLQIAIRNFLREHPDWKFRTYGPPPSDWMGQHGQIEIRGWVRFDDWPMHVNEFSIGLAPLQGQYDQCRSNLKLLEYQRLGIPWLATEDSPYKNPVRLRGGKLVKRNWLDALYDFVDDQDGRQQLGGIGLQESEDWLMNKHVADYEEILWGTI